MKKFFVILLAVALLLCGAFLACAVAEAPDAPAAAPVVDLTGLIIAVLLAAFEFLMARFARVLIPPAKKWLETHTTESERGLLWNAVCELVNAAEQIIKGPALGERRMAYVQAGLRQRGLAIDTDMIEAAVKQMNDRMMLTVGNAFDVTQDDVEDYMAAIEQVAKEPGTGAPLSGANAPALPVTGASQGEAAEGCAVKDYCELDENGNPIPEEPQSVNE